MKILFFIALFINIVFFLWEINSVNLNTPLANTNDKNIAKQILLVSELSKTNEKQDIISAENYKGKFVQIDVSESITNKSGKQPIEVLSVSEEISGNDGTQDVPEVKDKAELAVSQQKANDIALINQTESDELPPELNQKVLVEANKDDEGNGLSTRKSFWPSFSFIFDKENNYSSQINDSADAKGFPEATHEKDVVSSSFSAALKKWSVSIFGQSSIKDDGNNGQKNNTILVNTQQQAEKNYCYEVGPFVSYQAIEKWRKSNKINKDSLKKFNINNQVVSSYLVYHPAEDTFEQSKKIAKIYKKKRLSEVWLFRKGDLRGAISFGLFRKEKSAIKLQKKLIKNGLNVEIIERYKTQSVQYAQVLTKDQISKNKLIISELQTINECNYRE